MKKKILGGAVKRLVEDLITKTAKKNLLGLDQEGEFYELVFDSLFNPKVKIPDYLEKPFKDIQKELKKHKIISEVVTGLDSASQISSAILKRLRAGEGIDIVSKDLMRLRPIVQNFVMQELRNEVPELIESIVELMKMPPALHATVVALRKRSLNSFAKEIAKAAVPSRFKADGFARRLAKRTKRIKIEDLFQEMSEEGLHPDDDYPDVEMALEAEGVKIIK